MLAPGDGELSGMSVVNHTLDLRIGGREISLMCERVRESLGFDSSFWCLLRGSALQRGTVPTDISMTSCSCGVPGELRKVTLAHFVSLL